MKFPDIILQTLSEGIDVSLTAKFGRVLFDMNVGTCVPFLICVDEKGTCIVFNIETMTPDEVVEDFQDLLYKIKYHVKAPKNVDIGWLKILYEHKVYDCDNDYIMKYYY